MGLEMSSTNSQFKKLKGQGAGPTRKAVEQAFDAIEARGDEPACRAVQDITGGTTEVVRSLVAEVKAARRLELERAPLSEAFLLSAKQLFLEARKGAQQEAKQDISDAEQRAAEDQQMASELRDLLVQQQDATQEELVARLAAERMCAAEREAHEATRALLMASRDELALAKHELDSMAGELASIHDQLSAARREQESERAQLSVLASKLDSMAETMQSERASRLAAEQLLAKVEQSNAADCRANDVIKQELQAMVVERDQLQSGASLLGQQIDELKKMRQSDSARSNVIQQRSEEVARENGALKQRLAMTMKRLRSVSSIDADELEDDVKF